VVCSHKLFVLLAPLKPVVHVAVEGLVGGDVQRLPHRAAALGYSKQKVNFGTGLAVKLILLKPSVVAEEVNAGDGHVAVVGDVDAAAVARVPHSETRGEGVTRASAPWAKYAVVHVAGVQLAHSLHQISCPHNLNHSISKNIKMKFSLKKCCC
jgi:hypothetical protein